MLPVTGAVSRPQSRSIAATSEPGPGNRWAPWLIQYSPRGSDRSRPPSRSSASSSSTSRSRSRHAAASPAMPPPTTTTSRCSGVTTAEASPPGHSQARVGCLSEPKAELVSLQQLRCFCAAVELGSFSAAAEALRVSQPAVAEQIRKLEQLLGADLFARAARGVIPTEAGQAFAEHATRTLQTLEDAAASVSQFTSMQSGSLALGTFSAPSAWRLDAVVEAFLGRHPGMTVRLVGSNSSVIADRVRRGELEAAVVLLPVDDERLHVRPIVRDEVLYVTAAPERARRPATIEQLASTPLVFYDAEAADDDPIRRQLAERAQAHGVRLRPRVEVELIDLALRLVARGIGDTYLPSAYTHAPYFPTGLSTAPFSPALYDTFAIVTRPGARLSPAVRELIGELETHMRGVAEEFDRLR